jgi:Zn-dependent peptidase ImmA (M78 family)
VLDVAHGLRLKVKEEQLRGCDGVLVRPQGMHRGIIAVRKDIRSPGRKRFTIAHEIGHFVLHGHDDHGSICQDKDIEGWSKGPNDKERQADDFAAELLIPAAAVTPRLISHSPCLSVVESIADECRASLAASAWRYCDLTSEQCAIVWSENEQVAWSRASSEFPFFIKKNKQIEQKSYAYNCFKGESVPSHPELVPAEAWIDSWNLIPGSRIYEESRALPSYGSVLTLIWIKDRVEKKSDYDEEEDEPLDPNEFTVHRKQWPK